jgi:regulator of sigma E protease
MNYSRLRLPLGAAASISFQEVIYRTELILVFLGRLVTGRASVRNVGGIIYMTQAAGETARLGIDFLLSFMAMISLNLFLINLLPIPVLDGGHIAYNITEAIRGRPLSLRQKMIAQQIGLAIIIVVFAFVILNDIMRFVR